MMSGCIPKSGYHQKKGEECVRAIIRVRVTRSYGTMILLDLDLDLGLDTFYLSSAECEREATPIF